MSSLIRTPYPRIEGRPLFIEYEGGIVWILFHDHYHLDTRKKLVKNIQEIHPDTRTSGKASKRVAVMDINKAVKAFHAWQEKERKWYAHVGLNPPARKVTFRVFGYTPRPPGSPPPSQLKHRFPIPHRGRRYNPLH